MVGQYAFAMAITAPPILLAGCALRTVLASDALDQYPFGDYLSFRLTALAIAMGVLVLTMGLLSPDRLGICVAVGFAKVIESIADIFQGAMQQKERMELIGKSQFFRGAVTLFAAMAAFSFTKSVMMMCSAVAIASLLSLLLYDIPSTLRVHPGRTAWWIAPYWRSSVLLELLKLTFPLGLTVATGALIANLPRFFLGGLRGDQELGQFAALAWLTLAGGTLASSIMHAALPVLSNSYATGAVAQFRELSRQLISGSWWMGMVFLVLGSLLGPLVLPLVFGDALAANSHLLFILLGVMGLSFVICALDHVLYAARRFQEQVPLNLVATILMSLGCVLVTPRFGSVGTAYVVLAVTSLQTAARYWVISSTLSIWDVPKQPETILASVWERPT